MLSASKRFSKGLFTKGFLITVFLAVYLPLSYLPGHGTGVISGELPVINIPIPPKLTTAFPSCGSIGCHGPFSTPGARGRVTVSFTGLASIPANTDSSFQLSISSINPGPKGGFTMTTDRGVFKIVASSNTRLQNNKNDAKAVTHSDSNTRSWPIAFNSSQTGLVQWFCTGNTVNGNGRNDGDSWGWFGPDPSQPGTPFRLFVNDSKVTAFGKSCAGSKGFKPLIGAAKNAFLGQTFTMEVYNVPPKTIVLGILGASDKSWNSISLPFALDPFGMKGCWLNSSLDLVLACPRAEPDLAGARSNSHGPSPMFPRCEARRSSSRHSLSILARTPWA